MKVNINRKLRFKIAQSEKTIGEVALEIGITKTHMSRIMQGKVKMMSLKIIGDLCCAIKCTPNDLFELVDD